MKKILLVILVPISINLHAQTWKALYDSSDVYWTKGDYKTAADFLEKAKNNIDKADTMYSGIINDLGLCYIYGGLYEKSEPLLLEAKRIREVVFGKNHPEYGVTCSNLALLYKLQGLYDKAEPLSLEDIRIVELTSAEDDPNAAFSYGNLAELYRSQGLYKKAEPLLIKAKNILEKTLGKEDPMYAISCNNLAGIYMNQGMYDKAEILFIEAKKVYEKNAGKTPGEYATSLHNLAYLYDAQGQYSKAEPLELEAKSIYETKLGKDHPDYANACNTLAKLYYNMGLNDKAEPLFFEAKNIQEKVVGKNHPDYALICHNIALLYMNQKLYEKTEPFLLEAHQIYFHQIETQATLLSEKEKEAFFKPLNNNFEIFSTYVLNRKAQNPAIVATLYNNLLITKALLFSTQNKIRNNILSSGNKELIALYQNWQDKRNYLAKVYQMNLEEKKKRDLNEKKLEEEANNLEKQLSFQSEAFAQSNDKKRYTWQDVQKKLKHREAAIEIIRLHKFNKKWTDTTYYIALIVTPDSKLPELVLLENGNELENKYISYYKSSIRQQKEDLLSYAQFWKPIADRLKVIAPKLSRIYFSPDGIYNSVNLNTLLNTQTNKYLFKEINIQLLTNTKDLLVTKRENKKVQDASLFGYPDYGNKNNADTTRSLNISFQAVKTDSLKRFFENGKISMLPGTEKEVTEIEKLFLQKNWKSEKFTLGLASENKLKSLRNPRILHIATHGFFMSDVENTGQERGFAGFDNQKVTENPLLRSGLLLAGSQQAFDGKVNPDKEDGILTAYEAMNLNLDNTELVVLSACETGLGEIKNGEGVYGLQRAFQTAGAKAVIMSLWKVNDNSTQEFMTLFYENWLKSGNKRQAFSQAQNILKEKYKNPYFWGAFVMVGE